MKAIVVTDEAAGTAGMTLAERPEPPAAINDVVVQVHASGFVPTEVAWPSTWTDRRDRDRTPSIPGHELAGVVTALGYGTTGLSVGQRVFGLTDWHRDGTLAEYVAVEARNLAPLPGDVDFTVGASLPISGLTEGAAAEADEFDAGDLGRELLQDELDEGRREDLQEQLAAVERAEQRLAAGTYGVSVQSGEPIPDKRLEAVPTAELTVAEADEEARRLGR
jgi:D-arabinose 1-dehydrogenase-like Zn-dependent alcohol dehydrogenase